MKHLDTSTTKIYQGLVMYSFETSTVCLMVKVRGGYTCETPPTNEYKWIRGQHLDTLAPFFEQIVPIRYMG